MNKLEAVAFVVDILKQVIAGVLSGVILYMLLKDKNDIRTLIVNDMQAQNQNEQQ
ncbi:hypothetical protein [Fannyhessea vaginae]|uniref:hypothetical protein n=1 Tax=Fannyhessea vaginae TaxID=82135 RepID=UPI0023F47531|nr:hypothetical protein [Fannyhessea vaginae]